MGIARRKFNGNQIWWATEPPCKACSNYNLCRENRLACDLFVTYINQGGTGWPAKVEKKRSAPRPNRQKYEQAFNEVEDNG